MLRTRASAPFTRPLKAFLAVTPLEDRTTPTSFATGTGPGGGPVVKVFDGNGTETRSFYALPPSFTGGVKVAMADVTGDGTADIIAAPGKGGGPAVKVFDGASGAEVRSFFALPSSFTGGVNVAGGDVTGDGRADIIVSAQSGGGPVVKVFDGASGAEVRSFFALPSSFTGGVNVAGVAGAATSSDDGEIGSPATVQVSGLNPTGYNPTNPTVTFALTGATFGQARVFVNGTEVPASSVAVSGNTATAQLSLQDNRNTVSLVASDQNGLPVVYDAVAFAGNRSLSVTVRNASGTVAGATVTAQLSSDATVTQVGTTDANGVVQFANVPARTIILRAEGQGESGVKGVLGTAGTATVTLSGVGTPSAVANNDISQGTAGWNFAAGTVAVVNHKEGAGDSADADQDLKLTTGAQGEVSLTRDFTPSAGATSVKLRYRFVTAEVPGGYFNTQFDDYFSVSIRTKSGATAGSEANSMNGLGLSAFTFSTGETAWREVSVPVSGASDAVNVSVTVANVADGLYDSSVIVDNVTESKLSISAIDLKDIDNTALTNLSASSHSYKNGNTQVNGTITIKGEADDQLTSVQLQVLQGSSVIATGTLSDAAQTALIGKAFGQAGELKIAASQLLFNIASSQFPAQTADGSVTLRVVATSQKSEKAEKDATSVPILVQYDGSNRYGGRDEGVGGDDWVRPSVKSLMDQVSGVTWGDMSNMNGGPFSPHSSHQIGVDADGHFAGYNDRDAATVDTFVTMLNDASYGGKIAIIGVTYTDAFKQAIKDKGIENKFQNWDGHDGHFHIRWAP